MNKVKYNNIYLNNYYLDRSSFAGLTNGKIYDVIKVYKSKSGSFWDTITVINDDGNNVEYDLYDHKVEPYFIDVTSGYRNEVIDEILL